MEHSGISAHTLANVTEYRWASASSKTVQRLDAVLPAVLALVVLFATLLLSPLVSHADATLGTEAGERTAWVFVVAAASVAAAAMARRVQWPLYLMAVIGWICYSIWITGVAASYYAGLKLPRRWWIRFLIAALAVMAVPAIIGGRVRHETAWAILADGAAEYGTIVLLPAVFGRWTRARHNNARDTAAQQAREAAQLIDAQEARSEQARAQERTRIAREMHDVLAHRVALMVLHAGVLEVRAADTQTAAEARVVSDTGRQALTELREMLGILRDPGGPPDGTNPPGTLASLGTLIADTRAAGIPVTWTVDGEPTTLPSTVERTAYRLVQEAVAHGGSSALDIKLRHLPSALTINIVSAGPSGETDVTAIRERVELLGGTFDIQAQPGGGYLVHARLPAQPTEETS